MYYTVCYFICIFYVVVMQIYMLFIDNKDSVFCIQQIMKFISYLTTATNSILLSH